MSRAVVVTSHEIPERPAIRVEVGDEVKVVERDSDWPAFVFVETDTGSGWIPERYVERRGTRSTVTAPYDTTELPTEAGEELDVLAEDALSGWLWCRAQTGRERWVPARTVSRLP